MRVSLLTYSTKPRGGVVHTLNLAEALAHAGAQVTVWSLARGGDPGFFRPVDPAVTVRLARFDDYEGDTVTDRIVRSIKVLGDEFDPAAADIVHAQDCISANAVGRCIRTIHHLDHFTTPVLAACHEKAIVEPYARICVSSAVAREVEQGWGLRPVVIPNGVQADRYRAAAADTPEAVAARADWQDALGRYVLAVGGIEPRKGSIDLLEAYALMRQDDPTLRLVFAGGETLFDYRGYRADFDCRADELGINPIILGPVPDETLPALMAQAAVLAFPSTKEGFGLAAMEALAAGTPVVARDLPVLREVFGDTVRYAATPDDLATELLASMSVDDQRRQRGRDLAGSLTWEQAAHKHLAFYSSLL